MQTEQEPAVRTRRVRQARVIPNRRLEYEFVEEPFPKKPPRRSEELQALFLKMWVGSCLQVNRRPGSLKGALCVFRKAHGKERKFLIRELKPGWCRVWRVA